MKLYVITKRIPETTTPFFLIGWGQNIAEKGENSHIFRSKET